MTDGSDQNMDDAVSEKCMNAAVSILSRRNHTVFELKSKLLARNFSMKAIDAVIRRCQHLRYIDEHETGRQYIAERLSKGFGRYHIRFSMLRKGFDEELADRLIEEYITGPEEKKSARKALNKKSRMLCEEDNWSRKRKTYKFLSSRGFPASLIKEIL